MTVRIAINGYGRIGRNILRALYENKRQDIELVAINNIGDLAINAHLTKFDSTHGIFSDSVSVDKTDLLINGKRIKFFSKSDPSMLPWRDLKIDVVLECTGLFTNSEQARMHCVAGANKVLISAPAKNADATIVYGVNHHILTQQHTIVSNASCTTNCLAPLIAPLHKYCDVQSGLMTTIHAVTNDQVLADVYHTDVRRARSALHSIIPTKTGAAQAVGLVLPELAGKLDGFAMRVPTLNVSAVDLSIQIGKKTSVDEINTILTTAAQQNPSIVQVNTLPLVSIDFNHNSASSIFDLTQTQVLGNLVKVIAWYDNEWGFANRMLDTAVAMHTA